MADLIEFPQENLDPENQFLVFDDQIYDDPLFNFDAVNENHGGNYGADFSGLNYLEEINILNGNGNDNVFPENLGFGNPIRIPIWPVPPSSHSCTCCQTLREFFHVNGNHVWKLEIHGRFGMINHAVLERYNSEMSTSNHEYIMFDFCKESISSVKQFLVKYCDDRKREGYTMLQDPLSNFYDALCIGLDGYGNLDIDAFIHQTSQDDMQMNQKDHLNPMEEEGNGERLAKVNLAKQRERTGKMKLRDLVKYFHLPINVAAKKMNVCPSAIKGICRKEGLKRWPYRKIKSLENEIAKKKKSLDSNDVNEKARALTEINELQQKLANIYEVHSG